VSDAELLRQLAAAGVIFDLVLDNFSCRTAGILFAGAEQIGVVALPLVADQFLQLFEREAGQPR